MHNAPLKRMHKRPMDYPMNMTNRACGETAA
jgi:hypothetical protein